MKYYYLLILLAIAIILLAVGCSPAPPPEPTATAVPTVHPGKSVVNSGCVGCHDIGRVTQYKTDRQGWELLVDRMILSGARLTDEQRDLAVDYLALTYPKE